MDPLVLLDRLLWFLGGAIVGVVVEWQWGLFYRISDWLVRVVHPLRE